MDLITQGKCPTKLQWNGECERLWKWLEANPNSIYFVAKHFNTFEKEKVSYIMNSKFLTSLHLELPQLRPMLIKGFCEGGAQHLKTLSIKGCSSSTDWSFLAHLPSLEDLTASVENLPEFVEALSKRNSLKSLSLTRCDVRPTYQLESVRKLMRLLQDLHLQVRYDFKKPKKGLLFRHYQSISLLGDRMVLSLFLLFFPLRNVLSPRSIFLGPQRTVARC